MSILDRYIAKEFWKAFFGALLAFMALYIGADALRQGIKEDIPPAFAMQYSLYQIPEVLVMLLPAACLMGTIISLSSIARRNELIVMFASGISFARVAFVLLCLVFIVCCGSFIVTDRIVPPLTKAKARFYRTVIQKKPDLRTDIRRSKIWYRGQNMIYNLSAFDLRKNKIFGISIYTFDELFNLSQTIEAASATFKDNEWELIDGQITIFNGNPIYPKNKSFDIKRIVLAETPDDFREIEKEVETLRLKRLWKFIQRNKSAGIDTHSYEVMFWSKITMSLVPIVMAILGIPFTNVNPRHSSLARDIGICFFIIIIYWLILSTCLSLGKSGSLPPILAAWLPNLLFFSLGIFLIMRRKTV